MPASTRIMWFRPVAAIGTILVLAGCGDITGESPKIESKDKPAQTAQATPTPQATATAANTPTPATGWNDVAQRAFGLPVVERSTTAPDSGDMTGAATAPRVANADNGTSGAPAALTAPDPSLAESPGMYLRQAQASPVNWRVWNKTTFGEAAARNVPLIIVIGAAWSHDSRIMDDQVFSDPAISAALNEKFVPVRVDADERPDIWSRYRLAYEMINKLRAKPPLVAFALPDGRPFDVVSAVPSKSQGDIVGLQELLSQAAELAAKQPAEVAGQADAIEGVLAQLLAAPRAEQAELSKTVVETLATELSSAATGGDSEALRAGRVSSFLLHYAADNSAEKARTAASDLLLDRFRSGQRDHVMGGYFFRIPGSGEVQFGKVLPVQSEMISGNARAFALTKKGLHKEGVTEVMRFCHDWLEDPNGGFYTCQAPDVRGDDSGAYFTWTREEIAELAGDEKAATVFSTYLNAEAGKKTNLHVTDRLQKAADAAGVSYEEGLKALDTVRKKLNDARMAAEHVPMVDKSMIAAWNADMICAYLEAAKLADIGRAREFALKSADMIIESMVSERDGVARVLYKGRASNFGYLADNVKVAAALFECYRATDQKEYLDSAQSLMTFVESRFLDRESGLYRDFVDSGTSESLGLLRLKRLPLEDDISRAPNAVAAMVWYDLADATKDAKFKERGDRMVKAALERRAFSTEAVATWGEAALVSLNGQPKY